MARGGLALMLLVGVGGLCAVAAEPSVKVADRPRKILSLNLCADQLLLTLADRHQIAGLTPNAVDPSMSVEAAAARGLPLRGNSAEQIVAVDPDLIIGMPARGSAPLAALPDQTYPLIDLTAASTLGGIHASIRETAAAVGYPARGEAMIARMNRDLADLPKPGRGRVAAYYQRRGYLTGTGTLVDDLMRRVGLVNLASQIGRTPLAQLSVEQMVAADPDFLIVERGTNQVTDQGSEMLHHPALAHIPRISVDQAWTVCGTAAYTTAAHSIAAQIARLDGTQ